MRLTQQFSNPTLHVHDWLQMTIHAEFSPGGLVGNIPCVYLLILRNGAQSWHYVGRTGTSNRTGTSSPYKRLARHLAPVGNTQSCIRQLPEGLRKSASISFVALRLPERNVKHAETWMRWHLQDSYSLNRQKAPKVPPSIEKRLKQQLQRTFGALYQSCAEVKRPQTAPRRTVSGRTVANHPPVRRGR